MGTVPGSGRPEPSPLRHGSFPGEPYDFCGVVAAEPVVLAEPPVGYRTGRCLLLQRARRKPQKVSELFGGEQSIGVVRSAFGHRADGLGQFSGRCRKLGCRRGCVRFGSADVWWRAVCTHAAPP